jgi:hypothetical protein
MQQWKGTTMMVRKVKGFDIVRADTERTLAVFKDGSCVESGFPNFNAARVFVLGLEDR